MRELGNFIGFRDKSRGRRAENGARGWEVVQVALLLLLSLVVFFWPATLGGRVLLPTDLIFELDPLWQPLAPEGYAHPANRLLSDQVYAFFPWKVFTVRSFAQGHIPLWNPYINGGQPFVGNAQSAVFSPFNLIGYLLPLHFSYVITAILRLFVAGVFTFLFAREIGLTRSGALLATVAFTFSGPMIVWIGYPLSPVVAWLPAMLLTTERALTRRSAPYVAASGLTIAAQFLGGHPETSFHVMLAWAAYSLYRAVALAGWRPSILLPQLLRIATAAIIGTLLAAVQLAPFVEALLQSAILSARQTRVVGKTAALLLSTLLDWREWPTVVTAILPQYFGTPLDRSYLYPYSNYIQQNAYVGVLPLALAASVTLQGIKHRSVPHRNLILFFALLSGVFLGVAIRLPLLNAVNYAPLFNIVANERMRLIYSFTAAILAGLGLDGIHRGCQASRRTTMRILALLALVSLSLIALAYVGFVVFEDEIISFGRAFAEAQLGSPYFPHSLEHYYTQVEERYEKRLASFLPTNIVMYLPVLVALGWFAVHRWGHRLHRLRGVWTYAALGLTILDLFSVNLPFNPSIPSEHIFPTPDAVRFLRQDSGIYRVIGTGLTLYPNSGMVFGISDVRGYDAVVPRRYVELVDRVEGHYRSGLNSLFVQVDSPLLDLLNVKYVLLPLPERKRGGVRVHTDEEPAGLDGRWELVYRGTGGINVYRNRNVLPRAFVVYHAEVVDTAAQSLERVTDGDFNFRERVVLEEPPENWRGSPEPPRTPASASIVVYEPNRVAIEVTTAADGLLVLTDTYVPGWKARLDGQAARIYVADHAFRAVVVPAGTHQIEFAYEPFSFRVGAAVSLSTLVVLMVGLLLAVAGPRPSNSTPGT